MRATRIGMVVLLVVVALATGAFLLARPAAVRYAGATGPMSAMVSLRVAEATPVPEQVTIEVGNGVRITAVRLR